MIDQCWCCIICGATFHTPSTYLSHTTIHDDMSAMNLLAQYASDSVILNVGSMTNEIGIDKAKAMLAMHHTGIEAIITFKCNFCTYSIVTFDTLSQLASVHFSCILHPSEVTRTLGKQGCSYYHMHMHHLYVNCVCIIDIYSHHQCIYHASELLTGHRIAQLAVYPYNKYNNNNNIHITTVTPQHRSSIRAPIHRALDADTDTEDITSTDMESEGEDFNDNGNNKLNRKRIKHTENRNNHIPSNRSTAISSTHSASNRGRKRKNSNNTNGVSMNMNSTYTYDNGAVRCGVICPDCSMVFNAKNKNYYKHRRVSSISYPIHIHIQ
jgi:hypothetical protein